jgi:hypothetical protein
MALSFIQCSSDSSTLFNPATDSGDTLSVVAYITNRNKDVSNGNVSIFNDTIQPGDSISLHGRVFPRASLSSDYYWVFSNGTTASDLVVLKSWNNPGVYRPVFTVIDLNGDTLKASLEIHVNRPPVLDSLIAPLNNATALHPTSSQGLYFSWAGGDKDPGSEVIFNLQLSLNSEFDSETIVLDTQISTQQFELLSPLEPLEKYYWRVIAQDQYHKRDTSAFHSFSTRHPTQYIARLKGSVERRPKSVLEPAPELSLQLRGNGFIRNFITTNQAFDLTDVVPGNYELIVTDTALIDYQADLLSFNISNGEMLELEPVPLNDLVAPAINVISSDSIITTPQTSYGVFRAIDHGSGIDYKSVNFYVNQFNYSSQLILGSDSLLRWYPQDILPDGTYNIDLTISDFWGNTDYIEYQFSLNTLNFIHNPDTLIHCPHAGDCDPITLYMDIPDHPYNLVEFSWDFRGNGQWDQIQPVSTIQTNFSSYDKSPPDGSKFNMILRIKDSRGLYFYDSLFLQTNYIPSTPYRLAPDWRADAYSNQKIEWTESVDWDGHQIYYRLEMRHESSNWTIIADSLVNTYYPLNNFAPGYWRWRVTAYDELGAETPVWGTTPLENIGEFTLIKAPPLILGSKLIPEGSFTDKNLNQASISYGFWIDSAEVTQGEFFKHMNFNPTSGLSDDLLPVTDLNWYEAVLFANARSKFYGLDTVYTYDYISQGQVPHNLQWNRNAWGFRLATRDEWQHSARANMNRTYPTSNNTASCAVANIAGCRQWSVDAGLFGASPLGLRNMLGNVDELVWDTYSAEVYPTNRTDYFYFNPAENSMQQALGGSHNSSSDFGHVVQINRTERRPYTGLRLVIGGPNL